MFLHLDLDCFFVSCERTLDDKLLGRPVAVGGRGDNQIFSHEIHKNKTPIMINSGAFVPILFNSDDAHAKSFKDYFIDIDESTGKIRVRGIVTAASYEARKYGVKTGVLIRDALSMCPKIIILPPNHFLYHSISHKIREYLVLKIPQIEQYSIDEFFGNTRGWIYGEDNNYNFAKEIQIEIMEQFKVPISIGIAHSKWIAKLATSFAKPFGVKLVRRDELDGFIESIPIDEFAGVGRAFSKKLKSFAIDTLGEAKRSPNVFKKWGWQGEQLYRKICGTDNEQILPKQDRKSIGISRTFDPIYDRYELRRRVAILSSHLAHTIIKLNLNPTTFWYGIRYECSYSSKGQFTLDRLFSEKLFRDFSIESFDKLDTAKQLKVIRLAISATNFTNTHPKTLSLIDYEQDMKQNSLTRHLAKVRDKYGMDVVRYGNEL